MIDSIGVPYGNRTRVAAVKGRCPRPLDERDAWWVVCSLAQARYVNVCDLTLSNHATTLPFPPARILNYNASRGSRRDHSE